jgi:hypothetical protein
VAKIFSLPRIQSKSREFNLCFDYQAVYVGVRFIWWYESTTRGHWFGLLVVLVSNAFGYYALKFSAKPTIAENGDIEDGGADLTQRGLVEYVILLLCGFCFLLTGGVFVLFAFDPRYWWDLLYITWFIQISTLISDWFWLIYAIVRS